ncbi:MAG: DegQ family serine endoprotease [Bryobacterales bacterium]|nr:DegQ family serine endoprotease [Bryobacterales bacterium]
MTQNGSRFRHQMLIGGLLAVFGIGAVVGAVTEHKAQVQNAPPVISVRSPQTAQPAEGFRAVVKRDLPAVVNISTSKVVKVSSNDFGLPFNDPFFEQFFGRMPRQRPPQSEREHSLGSGVIVSHDGYILTNNHVVEKATTITVALSDKREFKAKLIGADAKTDLAVLKIDAKDLPTMTFGDSAKVEVGDYALAIGNPFGVGQTVTLGIVSATGRGNLGIEDYEDFIQTDAAINPGNSGGALVNSQGDLIGINTAIISPNSGGNNGVGFAIPANLARNVMDQIVTKGKVTRAYLGVSLQPVTPALAKGFGLKETMGAVVADVTPNTPASKAGLQSGDVLLAVNGKPIEDYNQFRLHIAMMPPGTTVNLKVLRGGTYKEIPVKLEEMPVNYGSAKMGRSGQEQPGTGLMDGVSVQNLDPQTLRSLNLPATTTGVVVTDVGGASAAAAAGLTSGDVIQEVNHQKINNVNEFQTAVAHAGGTVLLRVNRGGSTLFLAIESR